MELIMALVCERAVTTKDGKLDLHGVFNDLFAPGFPARQERLVLVLGLEWDRSDEGRFTFKVDLLDPTGRPVMSLDGHTDVDRRRPDQPPARTRLIMPLKDMVDFWRRTDRCQTASPRTLPDSSSDGTSVQVSDYQGCAPGSKLVFVNVIGGGHTWPDERIATHPKAGRVTHDIDGTQYVWDFFKNYSLGGAH